METKQINNEKIIENERDWKQHIRDVHNDMGDDIEYLFPNNSTEAFMTAIWKISVDLLERIEVMVIVDNKNDLYLANIVAENKF